MSLFICSQQSILGFVQLAVHPQVVILNFHVVQIKLYCRPNFARGPEFETHDVRGQTLRVPRTVDGHGPCI